MATKEKSESTNELAFANQETEQMLALAAEDGAKGFEHVTPDAAKLPMLTILQAQTPACLERNKHASIMAGNIYDNVACLGYEKLIVIPIMYKQRWIEWVPRDLGGGLVAIHKDFPEGAQRGVYGKSVNGENDLMDTRIHYVLYLDQSGFYNPAIISMASTGVGRSQLWISQMQQNRMRVTLKDGRVEERVLPMFSRHYEISTGLQKNKSGQQWYNWEIRPLLDKAVPLSAYNKAKSYYENLKQSDEQETKNSYSAAATEEAY